MIAYLFAAIVSISIAQEKPKAITIKEAVGMALDYNPDVRAAREKVVEVDEAKRLAITKAFPTLTATATAQELKAASNGQFILFNGEQYSQYMMNINLTQPLYAGGALTSAISFANKDRDIRRLELSILERDTANNVLQAFYTIILNQRQAELLRQVQSVLNQALKITERYFKIGRGQRADVLHLKAQLALLAPKIDQAEGNVTTSATQLATLIGKTDASQIAVSGTLASIDKAKLQLKTNVQGTTVPEVTRAYQLLSQFDDKRIVDMASNFPSLNIIASVGRTAFTKPEFFEDYAGSWSAGLQLTVPLFSGLSYFRQRGVYAAQERQLEQSTIKTRDQSKANQIQSEKALEVAEKVLHGAHEATVFSKGALKEAEREYRLQITDYLHLITSEQSYIDAATTHNQAKYDYVQALAKYFISTGISLADLIEILENNRNKEDI